jgi:hypothetical protein
LIKNLQPVAFVRQANIVHGPQRVNTGLAEPREVARAGKTENQQNKLWGAQWRTLDTGAKCAAGGADLQMETVGAVHRPTHSSR